MYNLHVVVTFEGSTADPSQESMHFELFFQQETTLSVLKVKLVTSDVFLGVNKNSRFAV